MGVTERDRQLIAALQRGLPLVPCPYAAVGETIGMTESEVLRRLRRLQANGVIRRLGVIVRHHELGYRANAMMVWAVPEQQVDAYGAAIADESGVTLCYRRKPAPPQWPYNLYCMIHGQDRHQVLARRDALVRRHALTAFPHRVLFSGRRFKQRGAWYMPRETHSGNTMEGADGCR
ncbi:AsnC family transcriptional regulator [Aquisalimonas sp.]|uniref:siroheme decarboxylase subunit beta n=1 Tax=Aquisalimonas sp. TaxID=1872621 RepID=UPI0025C735D5|nr:AsnC family transcriptional regulator [Aquisalimonas sp.]